MKAFIQHESRGRLRVRMHQYRMSLEQADLLEAYLTALPSVRTAAVYERTCDVVVVYAADRAGVVKGLAAFKFDVEALAEVPANSPRAVNREYQEKLVTMVAVKAACTLFLPTPLQIVRTVCMAAPFLCRGLRRLLRGQLRVEVLDALSIGVSMARRDFGTAGSVMFLLQLGERLQIDVHSLLVGAGPDDDLRRHEDDHQRQIGDQRDAQADTMVVGPRPHILPAVVEGQFDTRPAGGFRFVVTGCFSHCGVSEF